MKVHEIVTQRIIEELEKGVVPWKRPWKNAIPAINYVSRKAYRGVNRLLLPLSGEYLTWNQLVSLGGKLKKGAQRHIVVFWKQITVPDEDSNSSDPEEKKIPFLRYYTVYHLSDIDGIESKIVIDADSEHRSVQLAEEITSHYPAPPKIVEVKGSNEAFYLPSQDQVVIPVREQFSVIDQYYSVKFHELVHSTGHSSRLDRFGKSIASAAFGSDDYSKEELIAEIGAAMLLQESGIDNMEQNSAYIAGWLSKLRNDPKMIIVCSQLAQKAVSYIRGENLSMDY